MNNDMETEKASVLIRTSRIILSAIVILLSAAYIANFILSLSNFLNSNIPIINLIVSVFIAYIYLRLFMWGIKYFNYKKPLFSKKIDIKKQTLIISISVGAISYLAIYNNFSHQGVDATIQAATMSLIYLSIASVLTMIFCFVNNKIYKKYNK